MGKLIARCPDAAVRDNIPDSFFWREWHFVLAKLRSGTLRRLRCDLGNQLLGVIIIIYELRLSISSIRAFTSLLTRAAGRGLLAGKRIVGPFPDVS